METELLKAVIDNISELMSTNHDLINSLREAKDDSVRTTNSLREELHSAKAMIHAYEDKIIDLQKRCDRLQEKYDALHDKYDTLVVKSCNIKEGRSSSKSEVHIVK